MKIARGFILFLLISMSSVYSQTSVFEKGSRVISGTCSFSSQGGDLYE